MTRPALRPLRLIVVIAAASLAGCTTVGPDFVAPEAQAPTDWTSWRSGDDALRIPVSDQAILREDWWRTFDDPVLDALIVQALDSSPDLQTAALHYAQARVERGDALALGLPQVGSNVQVARQRISENGASTRIAGALGGDNAQIITILGQPYTLYQAGFDASWEIDLWGRVARSLEAADAKVAGQAALLEMARLSIAGNLAQSYFQLRDTQRSIALSRADIAVLEERIALLAARADGGIASDFEVGQQRAALQAAQAQLPALLAREAQLANQIALLLGTTPGTLGEQLQAPAPETSDLPDLALGLPSEIALRRPDIRAAEARLHAATARIGVARAELYPSIRLGGMAGLEALNLGDLFKLASGTYALGPSIDLPLFDGGRRKRNVQLRELDQQEAAIAYQKTLLQAWQEIDDALASYAAEHLSNGRLIERETTARDAHELAHARQRGGLTSYLEVLDSQRSLLQAQRDLSASNARLHIQFVAINTAVGNMPSSAPAASKTE